MADNVISPRAVKFEIFMVGHRLFVSRPLCTVGLEKISSSRVDYYCPSGLKVLKRFVSEEYCKPFRTMAQTQWHKQHLIDPLS